jgi:hypothetical protein
MMMSLHRSIVTLSLLLTAFATSAAHAGDGAALHVFGFSPDGQHFAYEESGIEDGSGFSFDRIVIVDVPRATIAWTALSRVTQEGAGERAFEQARAALRSGADLALRDGGLSHYLARLVAQDPSVRPFDYLSADIIGPACYGGKTHLHLPDEGGGGSSSIGIVVPKAPFALGEIVLTATRKGLRPVSLAPMPIPRAEPSTYASLAAVYVGAARHGQTPVAAIVNECHEGFEGPDRRFLATLATIPGP